VDAGAIAALHAGKPEAIKKGIHAARVRAVGAALDQM
jgi:hypothetical protein